MPQKIQSVIDEILKCSVDSKEIFGDHIAASIFKCNQNALYLNSAEKCAYCFCSVNNESERREAVLFILELLSVLHDAIKGAQDTSFKSIKSELLLQ